MEFFNKKNRTMDIPKFDANDIIKSVANIVTDRHYYAEEMVNQAKSLELYVENGKYIVEDVKSGQKLHIPALTPQVKAIIDKYFSLHQDPVDLLISGTGDVLKINPEGNFEPEEVATLKTEIKKSNLWRLTNAQKPEKMPQQPINEDIEYEYSEGFLAKLITKNLVMTQKQKDDIINELIKQAEAKGKNMNDPKNKALLNIIQNSKTFGDAFKAIESIKGQFAINEEETEDDARDNDNIDAIVNAVDHFAVKGGSASKLSTVIVDSVWEGLEEALDENPALLEAVVTLMVKQLRDYLQD